jgi:hypothetical protein
MMRLKVGSMSIRETGVPNLESLQTQATRGDVRYHFEDAGSLRVAPCAAKDVRYGKGPKIRFELPCQS